MRSFFAFQKNKTALLGFISFGLVSVLLGVFVIQSGFVIAAVQSANTGAGVGPMTGFGFGSDDNRNALAYKECDLTLDGTLTNCSGFSNHSFSVCSGIDGNDSPVPSASCPSNQYVVGWGWSADTSGGTCGDASYPASDHICARRENQNIDPRSNLKSATVTSSGGDCTDPGGWGYTGLDLQNINRRNQLTSPRYRVITGVSLSLDDDGNASSVNVQCASASPIPSPVLNPPAQSACAGNNRDITLNWSDQSADYYQVLWGGPGSPVNVPGSQTSYVVPAVPGGTNYTYTVRAYYNQVGAGSGTFGDGGRGFRTSNSRNVTASACSPLPIGVLEVSADSASWGSSVAVTQGTTVYYRWTWLYGTSGATVSIVDSDDICSPVQVGGDEVGWATGSVPPGTSPFVTSRVTDACQAGHTYTLRYTVTGPGGTSVPATASVTVLPITPGPSASLLVNCQGGPWGPSVGCHEGETVGYQWDWSNADFGVTDSTVDSDDTCVPVQVGGVAVPWLTGSVPPGTSPFTTYRVAENCQVGHTYTFAYRVSGSGDNAEDLAYVSILPAVGVGCAISSFTATNPTPAVGSSTDLLFTLSGAFAWTISIVSDSQGGNSVSPNSGTGTGGTAVTSATLGTQTYRLTCGGEMQELSVTHIGAAASMTFGASPNPINPGETTVLSWDSVGTTGCTATVGVGTWPGAKAVTGSETSAALSATTEFRLGCTASVGPPLGPFSVWVGVTVPGDFSVSVTPAWIPMNAGETVTRTVTVTSLAAWSGVVNLDMSPGGGWWYPCPALVSCTISPPTVIVPPWGSVTATLTITADPLAASFVNVIAARGTSGSMVREGWANLVLTAVPPSPQVPNLSFASSGCSAGIPRIILNYSVKIPPTVARFELYRNGVLIFANSLPLTTNLTFTDSPVVTGTSYAYTARAFTAAGTASAYTSPVTVIGPSCMPTPNVSAQITAMNGSATLNLAGIKAGDTLTYAVRYQNAGQGTATLITPTIQLSANIPYITGSFTCLSSLTPRVVSSCSGVAVNAAANSITFSRVNLGAGTQFFAELRVTVATPSTQSKELLTLRTFGNYQPGNTAFDVTHTLLAAPTRSLIPKFREVSP